MSCIFSSGVVAALNLRNNKKKKVTVQMTAGFFRVKQTQDGAIVLSRGMV